MERASQADSKPFTLGRHTVMYARYLSKKYLIELNNLHPTREQIQSHSAQPNWPDPVFEWPRPSDPGTAQVCRQTQERPFWSEPEHSDGRKSARLYR